MDRYWKYSRRGGWAFAFLLAVNLPTGILIKVFDATLDKDGFIYSALMFAIFIFVFLPFAGLVFEYFAIKSPRIGHQSKQPGTSA